jgi:RHH-type proline utilization regulon transcriptional repressor/proline dehydrogenase/delta 1-pyrroline-5-carboxylate dehydrogenase
VVLAAMRILGRQFVMGRTIEAALARAGASECHGYRHSYDMLGEAARTAGDAARYHAAYLHAIDRIGAAAGRGRVSGAPSISVKLSALHPRYEAAQRDRAMRELLPRLIELCHAAKAANIGLTVDAEEADRLELSLDLFEAAACDPGPVGLGRSRACGSELSETRPGGDRLARRSGGAFRAPPDGAAGQGRLLGQRD